MDYGYSRDLRVPHYTLPVPFRVDEGDYGSGSADGGVS